MSPFQLRQAALAVAAGRVIAYPTEAVFGLGCDPLDGAAVRRLLHLKDRPLSKGLILIAADISQLRPFIAPLSEKQRLTIADTWPGPVTWVLPAADNLPAWLSGGRATIAVRVTAHPAAAELCRAAGTALVSTSANPTGRPPARTALQVRQRCPGVDLILSGPTGGRRKPTEIRSLSGELLRAG